MPVTDVREIRLLPPLAIGRFGGSQEPMHNYDAVISDDTGFRSLVPAETLILVADTGEIVARRTPPAMAFKDGAGLVKPVCPFLEVWALFDDEAELRPLTLNELGELGRGPEHLSWAVQSANLKMLRRTGQPGDRVEVSLPAFSDHVRRALNGIAPNFKAERSVYLGWVQYVKPTPKFPEIRFRFVPPAGQVYGHTQDDVVTAQNAVYDRTRGTWDNHSDSATDTSAPDPRARITTIPSGIYASDEMTGANLGYLDDSSDGIVTVTLTLEGKQVSSFARISAGPPDFAPDSLPVRTMGDEIEQLALGPTVEDVTAAEVIDIVRRALETIRLVATDTWNQRYARNAFDPALAAYAFAHQRHSRILASVAAGLAAAPDSDERRDAVATLTLIDGIVREYDAVADRRRASRQRMPALMRGADGNDLALNRRQRSKLRKALEVFQVGPGAGSPEDALLQMIATLSGAAVLHSGFSEDGKTLAASFADPLMVLDYLRKAAAKGAEATAAGLAGQLLVVAGDPDGSAFPRLISRPAHPMNGPLSSYHDPSTGQSGIEVVRTWIMSLGPGV